MALRGNVAPVTGDGRGLGEPRRGGRHPSKSALRTMQVEPAQYEADLARQRFMKVDPNHCLVADGLEAGSNGKLNALNDAQERCDREQDVRIESRTRMGRSCVVLQ